MIGVGLILGVVVVVPVMIAGAGVAAIIDDSREAGDE